MSSPVGKEGWELRSRDFPLFDPLDVEVLAIDAAATTTTTTTTTTSIRTAVHFH